MQEQSKIKLLALSACAVGALMSQTAMADAPGAGNNDTSFINQITNAGTATSIQSGSNDYSRIDQIGANSSQNLATVLMAGVAGGRSTVSQDGASNTAYVTTSDDGSSASTPITVSSVTQSGTLNLATVDQFSRGGGMQTTSAVTQSASGNFAQVLQRDNSQSSILSQSSDGNTAYVYQGDDNSPAGRGYGNHSEINQGGVSGSNVIRSDQTQALNSSSYATQLGTHGTIRLVQIDDGAGIGGNSSTVSQLGATNVASVSQTGANNASSITSALDNNNATVQQIGHDNASTVRQSATSGSLSLNGSELGLPIVPAGGSNSTSMAIVKQNGAYLTSTTISNGASDFAFVQQGAGSGDNHILSYVDQSAGGANNLAFVDQLGSNQVSYFKQSGTDNQASATSNGAQGIRGALGIHQYGNGNYSIAHQTGSFGKLNIIQDNAGARTRAITPGIDTPPGDNTSLINNYSIVNQDGVSNEVYITQAGDGNRAEVDQVLGSSNIANITQALDGGMAGITQLGAGNSATIIQGSTFH